MSPLTLVGWSLENVEAAHLGRQLNYEAFVLQGHEGLSWIPSTQTANPGLMMHACNLRAREAEAVGSLEFAS